MNRNQAVQIYNTLFLPSSARVFARYEGVPPHLKDGPEPDNGPGKRRAAALLRAMADALDPPQADHQQFAAKHEFGKQFVKRDSLTGAASGKTLEECMAAVASMAKVDLVLIEWVDSRQPDGAWRHLAGDHDWAPVKCASVGWLIEDTDEVKVLAPNTADIDDASNMQFSGAIVIPAKCVVMMRRLEDHYICVETS